MASFKTLDSGSVRAFVCVNGIRDSKAFKSRAKAKSWARDRESELSKLKSVEDDTRTFGDLFERYAQEVSPTKEGEHWEVLRLNMFIREFKTLCSTKLVKSSKEDIKDWILLRAKTVASSTINRELNIMSNCLTFAREEWHWMSHNPMQGLRRPKNPKSRSRRISEGEIREICFVLGYQEDTALTLKREFVAVAFLFAIETAMRAGEICSLTRSNICFDTRVAHLEKTKNGDQRDVPLSDRAIELIHRLPLLGNDEVPVFQLESRSLSTIFRTNRNKTTIEDLTFHDTRHEATTRLAGKLHVLALASVTGHRDIKELMTYYDESAADIAKQLREKEELPATVLDHMTDDNYTHLAQRLLQELSKASSGVTLT